MNALGFDELMSILQNNGETERIEAKRTKDSLGKSILETISAFSNEPDLGGGYLVLGLTKNTSNCSPHYDVTGVSDADKLQSEIATLCRQSFNNQIRPDLQVLSHEGKTIIIIYIPEAESYNKPVYIKSRGIDNGAFRRFGPTDQQCTQEDLDYLYQRRSKKKYDETVLSETSFEDIDLSALKVYRTMREEVNKNAKELKLNDEDLLQALSVLVHSRGSRCLTVAGFVLFGSEMALRRVLPMATRVDYIMIDGREWVPNPDKRYHHTIEIGEGLFTGIYRLLHQIMTDIPQAFSLDENQILRKDSPLVPRNVIREALCNALMHRD
ncbi:MAG: hypothetical protein S4CHLAM2_10730 [Chlamydiales bacterium]|nr:hypothetical protein [Chlamydiales bacterium]